jgi:putative transposase
MVRAERDRHQLHRAVTTYAVDHAFGVITYCFMPDHSHLLVEGQDDQSDLQEFLRIWKQCSEFHVRREFGPRLWQRGFFSG